MNAKKNIILCILLALSVASGIIYVKISPENFSNQTQSFASGKICINEICSDYFPTMFSETYPASDWIELYNHSEESINLSNYYLSDDKHNLYKYQLPSIILTPDSYYVIHAQDTDTNISSELLNFRINNLGETLYLSTEKGTIDVVNVPTMSTNTSWSRISSVSTLWANTELTYSHSNEGAKTISPSIESPIFSVESGFYNKEFELELSASKGSSIYYTLDGSDPCKHGILYKGPIHIKDMSNEPNVYSARTDFTPANRPYATNTVDKITVVRAIAINEKGHVSNIVTNSYLVGLGGEKCYSEMYTVSLVTDPDNLFDYNEGIYVTGNVFNNFVANGGNTEDIIQADANYRIHGKCSERPASLEIFDENGKSILDREVGIRIHGNTTRGIAQKSFSVYAREIYDGSNIINNLFGANTCVHKFFIYTNREGTKLRDALLTQELSKRNIATQSFIYCNVFLDGEYWGIYLLSEVYDEYYFNNHYGISQDNIQIHEGASPPDVIDYLNTVSDRSNPTVYETLNNMIDIQSFIDYYAAMLYLNNSDWLFHNSRCYRSIKPGTAPNEDCKWRWGLYDNETAMYDAYVNTFHYGNIATWQDDILAQTLMEHEEFRKQFVITYMDLYNNLWQEERIVPIISELEANITNSFAKHSHYFNSGTDTTEYIDKLKNFFIEREEHAFLHVKEEFGLNSDPVWLVLLSNTSAAASYSVNTSIVNVPDAWWQGLYFPDFPVTLSVNEIYGNNTFLGWYTENDILLSTENNVTINLTNDINIVYAKFEN